MNIGILAHVLSEQPFTFKDFIMAAVVGSLGGVLFSLITKPIYLYLKNKKEQKEQKEQQEQKENNTE